MTEKENIQQVKTETQDASGKGYLLKLIFRMRYWILLCCAVLGLAVFISLRFVTCLYERTIVLKVDMSVYVGSRDSLSDAEGDRVGYVRDYMEANVLLLQSQPVVDNALKLMVVQNGNAQVETVEMYSHNKSNLTAQYSKYSDVIRLSFRSPEPKQADAFLLALVESYNSAVRQNQAYDYAFITVIDPPQGSDKPVYPHKKLLYLLAVVLGVILPLTWAELKDWWHETKLSL